MSKHNRHQPRETMTARDPNPTKPPEGPAQVVHFMTRDPEGFRYQRARIPASVLAQYIEHQQPPDVKDIAMAHMHAAIEKGLQL